MSSTRTPRARSKDLSLMSVDAETVVYDERTGKAHCLNQTSALVWKSCNGSNTAGDIASSMERELGTAVPVDVVSLAIAELGKAGLLELPEGTRISQGISRREAFRRTAGITAVALPLITTLLVPTPASAQSVDCTCINPGQCLTKTACPNTQNCNGQGICAP